jgi:3-oxoacyl-[acyl-carrier-protein] synthase-3
VRWDNIYLAGVGVHLPEDEYTAEQAVADGVYDAKAAEANGIRAVRVARPEESGPVMAAAAGRQAIERSGHRPEEFDAILHGYVGHQGREFWSPAHYVQNETVGSNGAALTMEVRQGSNGHLGGLELAAAHLTARPDATAALITSGDAFHLPFIDRWTSDNQTVFGDGAVAAVLSKRDGFAKLISTVSTTEPSLEPLFRGSEAWSVTPFDDGKPVNIAARTEDWLMRNEDAYDDAVGLVNSKVAWVLDQLTTEAGITIQDADWFVHATLIKPLAEWSFYKTFGLDRARTTYDWGLDYGHMGNCDQFAGINHLYETGRLKSGDRLITIGAGIGFMWTAAILEII